jgi:hypothetical protein
VCVCARARFPRPSLCRRSVFKQQDLPFCTVDTVFVICDGMLPADCKEYEVLFSSGCAVWFALHVHICIVNIVVNAVYKVL